jgi:hypothetical protein
VPHGAAADRHPPEEAASGHDGLFLREDEVHHRGQGAAELRAEKGIQREVGQSGCFYDDSTHGDNDVRLDYRCVIARGRIGLLGGF